MDAYRLGFGTIADDYRNDITTTGSVTVGGTATGEIEIGNDFDWFAVELEAGKTYVIDLEGFDSGGGTLDSTVLRGLYNDQGERIAGTQTNNGGVGDDARLTFTATETGTYYIAARGYGKATGTYTVRVSASDDTRDGARDLGDITDHSGLRYSNASLDGDGDRVDYFRFTLTDAMRVNLGLRRQDADADLYLENAQGNVIYSSTRDGTAKEWISKTLVAGTYYVRVEAQEEAGNDFRLTYRVDAPRPDRAPVFAEASYAFDLAENADGSSTSVALGTVLATDREAARVVYSIAAGNHAGLFEVDGSTGALSYKGTGEDHESGTTSYGLTVRASDGSLHSDVTVTVSVTDVAEAPAFAEASYAFDLAENVDGSTDSVALGAVSAADPEDATLTYSIEDGDDAGLFEIDGLTGALTYKGAGEDYESGTTSYELTVRANDGSLHSDVTVTVNVTDVVESVPEPEDEDLPDDTTTTGRVVVGDAVNGKIGGEGVSWTTDKDWFAVELEVDRTYVINLRGSGTDDASLQDPYLRGLYDSAGNWIAGTKDDDGGDGLNSRVTYTATESGTHYISVGRSTPLFPVVGGSTTAAGGSYELEVTDTTDNPVSDELPDDFAAGTATTGVLVPDSDTGVALEFGDIDSDGDVDWFAIDLEADQSVILRLIGYSPETRSYHGGITKPEIKGVYDSDGNLIPDTSAVDGREARLLFKATDAGTYYVAAGSFDPTASGTNTLLDLLGLNSGQTEMQTGKYTIAMSPGPTVDDYTDDTSTTGELAVEGSVQGNIEWQDDHDWFAVDLTAGVRYELGLTGGEDTQEYPVFGSHILDSQGNLHVRWKSNSDSQVEDNSFDHGFFTPDASGTYYIPVTGGSNDSFWFGSSTYEKYWDEPLSYTLTLAKAEEQPPEDDFAADTSTTGDLEVEGDAVSGEIGTGGDVDWFAVDLVAGKTYVFFQTGSRGSEDNTLQTPNIVGLYDSDGAAIEDTGSTDRSNGFGAERIAYKATETGTHYLAVGSDGWWSSSRVGTYTVEAHEIDNDSIAADSTTTETMDDPRTVWFEVELDASEPYRISVEAADGDSEIQPFRIEVYQDDGTLVETYWRSIGTDDQTVRILSGDNHGGTHYVVVTTDADNDSTTYEAEVHELDPATSHISTAVTVATQDATLLEEAPGWAATTPMPKEFGGVIETVDDVDWIAIDLEAGKSYDFGVGQDEFEYGSYPGSYLGQFVFEGLYDSDGERVVEREAEGEFSYEAAADGTYYVAVAGGDSWGLGHYRVTVEEQPEGI